MQHRHFRQRISEAVKTMCKDVGHADSDHAAAKRIDRSGTKQDLVDAQSGRAASMLPKFS